MSVVPAPLWTAVHEVATGRPWPPADGDSAVAFVDQAEREGLLPLLAAEEEMPPAVRSALEGRRAWLTLAQKRSALQQQTLADVAALLRDEEVIAFKGADYASRLYPRPELRPMADVDLLVPAGRMDAVGERLRGAGWEERIPASAAARSSSYHERVFLSGGVVLEVHRSVIRRSRHHIDYEGLFRRSVPAADLFGARRLEAVDAVLVHAVGMAKDEFSIPLVRHLDFWLMVSRVPLDATRTAERAAEWLARRALYGAVHQCATFFPELRTAPLATAAEALLARPTRAFLDLCVLPTPAGRGSVLRGGRVRQLWRKFWLIDGLAGRVRFAAAHALAALEGSPRPRGGSHGRDAAMP